MQRCATISGNYNLDYWITSWIIGLQVGFLDYFLNSVNYWIILWITRFSTGFLDFQTILDLKIGFSRDCTRLFLVAGPLVVTHE